MSCERAFDFGVSPCGSGFPRGKPDRCEMAKRCARRRPISVAAQALSGGDVPPPTRLQGRRPCRVVGLTAVAVRHRPGSPCSQGPGAPPDSVRCQLLRLPVVALSTSDLISRRSIPTDDDPLAPHRCMTPANRIATAAGYSVRYQHRNDRKLPCDSDRQSARSAQARRQHRACPRPIRRRPPSSFRRRTQFVFAPQDRLHRTS